VYVSSTYDGLSKILKIVMKKVLLLLVALTPMFVAAQSRNLASQLSKARQPASTIMVNGSKIKMMALTGAETTVANSGKSLRTAANNTPHGLDVGNTSYDLQTNAAVARRHYVYDPSGNNNLTTLWTMAQTTGPTFSDRGTGYNHYQGSSYGPFPSSRIEAERTGWPMGVRLPSGEELIVSHDPATGSERLRFYKNTGLGSTSFAQFPTNISSSRAIWPRMASSGDNIYVITNHQDTGFQHPTSKVKIPTFYSRSTDAGATWTNDHIQLPGYDTSRYVNGGGDTYSIDAKDNIVAIVLGGYYDDVAMWKSTDYGVTFTKTLVDSFPLAGFYNMNNRTSDIYLNNDPSTPGQDGIPDTLPFNDGSVDVLIDNNNMVHVFFGLSRGVKPGISSDSAYFFPGTNGLVHWTEANPNVFNLIGYSDDCDGDGVLNITDGTVDGGVASQGGRYRLSGLSSMPSAGIDASGNIYCVYTAVNELDITNPNIPTYNGIDQNFRDIHVNFSTDGGLTWAAEPQNITNDQLGTFNGNEEVYASISRNIGSTLEISYQFDTEPGTELQNGDDAGLNHIIAVSVTVNEILNNTFENACGKSTAQTALRGPFDTDVSSNKLLDNAFGTIVYPNPTLGITTFNFELNNGGTTEILVSNLMGQTVFTVANGNFNAGFNEVKADFSSLSSGLYLYTIRAEGKSFTGRLVVNK
jgi:hypothetical protein